MAFPTSPFSIREYALKMRGKDLTKSWPFSGTVEEEMAAALLPPITVRKFRWWSHEVDILRSNIDSGLTRTRTTPKMIKKQGGGGGGGGGGFNYCKAKSSRTPKKRSIAEIFAVAPPVETMMMISNDCEVEKVVGKLQKNGDKVKPTSLATTLVSAINKFKFKPNNNINLNKIKDFGEEQHCKRGQRNHKDVSVFRCKKPCYKRLSNRNKQKLVNKSNVVVGKKQKPMAPVKSILKPCVKLVVSETNSSSANLKCSDHVISNGGIKSDTRRVSFSDKDDVLESSSTKAFSDHTFEQNDDIPFEALEGSIKSGESNEDVVASMDDNDVVSFRVRHEVDSQHMEGKIDDQLPNIHDRINARPHDPCWDNANHSTPEELISINRAMPHETNLHLFDHVLAAQEEREYEHVRTECGSSFWPRANSSAKDMTRCRFPNWEQSAVAYEEKDVNDGFVCLPLNSKGELIQLNSGLVNRFDQMNEASNNSNNMACSSRKPVCGLVLPRSSRPDYFVDNEAELTGNQLSLFPLHSNMQENRNRYSSAGFDVDEAGTLADIRLRDSERGTECGRFFHSNLPNPSCNRCRHFGKLHNHNVSTEMYPENRSSMLANPARQTMRLMGKDVAVGVNGKEIQEAKVINFWKNSTSIENRLTNPAVFHSNQMAQRNLLANASQVRYPHPRLDRTMYQISDSIDNIHFVSPSSTDQAPFISCPETLRFSSQPSNNYETAKMGAFNFPFLQPDDENHVLPPWTLRGRQWREAPTANAELVHINGYYNNPFISSDVLISPRTHRRHEAAYPCSTMPSHLQMKNMPSSTPFFQPTPVAPRVQSPSIRMSTEDRLKFNSLSVKDSDFSIRRPAADLVDSRKRRKISSIEMDNASVVHGWTRGKFIDGVESNPGRKAEAFKVECMGRSGPMKLTAGTKHVLKPSHESMDIDNTNKPTYSTIPSAGLAHSVSLTESQKSTKVYSF